MKAAVCISGHLGQKPGRTPLIDVANSIQKFFSQLSIEVDYFLVLSFDENTSAELIEFYNHQFPVIQKKIFKDDSFPINSKKYTNIRKETHVERTYKMLDKILSCNNLKKIHETSLNFKYDVVFRIRPDMLFLDNKHSELQSIITAGINDKHVYLPKFPWIITKYTVVDFFAFGNSKTMDIYSEVINHIDSYYNKGLLFHPETLLGFHLKSNGIKTYHINPICFFSEKSLDMYGFEAEKNKRFSPYRILELLKYIYYSYKPYIIHNP
jgi:hypothetical protein